MRMTKLAWMNVKNSFKSYLSVVISLAFTILVLYNFQNMIYSETFVLLGERNREYINMLIQTISIVLACFMFFFIWYATNVFLAKRKKEIGIYIFMGLSNQKIGTLYMIETFLIGVAALLLGLLFGMITAGLFQMIMLAISDIVIPISFRLTVQPIVYTVVVFLAIYLFFVVKGYWNIVRSSVLSMISAMRQNEYVEQKKSVLMIKAVLGIGVLVSGYYYAIKDGGAEVSGNVLVATILVIIGVYLLFGGMIPLVFQTLLAGKHFLYRKERCLWMNSVVFRMKKNYRTYAMVCILGICSITALATGFAMKQRYENMVLFDNTYTFQILSDQDDLEDKVTRLIEEKSDIAYQGVVSLVCMDEEHMLLSYSQVRKLAQEAQLAFEIEEPAEDEVIKLSHLTLLSFYTKQSKIELDIQGEKYWQIEKVRIPYLGYLQKQKDFYMISDKAYERLKQKGEVLYLYNYKISDPSAFAETKAALDVVMTEKEGSNTGRVAIDPNSKDMEWIKILHAICIFMFLVFVVASGCIMYMKLYNDAFEEQERYRILSKLGLEEKALKKSIAKELATAYILPFIVMTVSAYFSVHALEKMMYANLFSIYVMSVLVVLAVFSLCYGFSVVVYQRNVGIR